jgi:hypothetical protein
MSTIHLIFEHSSYRPAYEKVIDYAAEDDQRLSREIAEYEVTENVESCFRKFLEQFGTGVRTGDVTEVGIWVSGFYGSGKSRLPNTSVLHLIRIVRLPVSPSSHC